MAPNFNTKAKDNTEKSCSLNTTDWLKATKDLKVSPYSDYYQEKAEPEQPFTRTDFEQALRKAKKE